ncbi:LIM-domain-containing protein [Panus rudis PR-1116 ss-1]|nr:LIM-domain-containing protein [Panus rudis PR-1116 ss-1]
MHPFGGTPYCPRCGKAVYAAEQIMGPGRKLYHKACLKCTSCSKRLDSLSLLEHDQEPYCKQCHVKNFGTRDLRNANLPDRDDVLLSPPTSPTRHATNLPTLPLRPAPSSTASGHAAVSNATPSLRASPLPVRRANTGGTSPDLSIKPNRALSPTRGLNPPPPTASFAEEKDTGARPESPPPNPPTIPSTPTNTGRVGNFPRTVPLNGATLPSTPHRSTLNGSPAKDVNSLNNDRPLSPGLSPTKATGNGTNNVGKITAPLVPNATGIRYGAALGGSGRTGTGLSPTVTGGRFTLGSTPMCGTCGKSVYFAEQVKAVGKTFHKGCLRCKDCNTLLDSTRLTEKEGDPYCNRCYSRLFGPQGSGYALLGKPGG